MSDSNPLNSIREVIGRQKATSKAMAEILSNSRLAIFTQIHFTTVYKRASSL